MHTTDIAVWPRPQPFTCLWSDTLGKFQNITALKVKRVLLIGYSDEQASVLMARENFDSAVRLALWADHIDLEGTNFPVVVGDISKRTEFEDNEFDAVLTSALLEHINDLEGAFIEIKRITKSSGLFISEFGPVWSGACGHHLYLDPGHSHLDFQQRHLPSHMHLLFTRDEITEYLINTGVHAHIADQAVYNIFDWNGISRVMYDDYEILSNKHFRCLVRLYWTAPLSPEVLARLVNRYPTNRSFDVEGGFWILTIDK